MRTEIEDGSLGDEHHGLVLANLAVDDEEDIVEQAG